MPAGYRYIGISVSVMEKKTDTIKWVPKLHRSSNGPEHSDMFILDEGFDETC